MATSGSPVGVFQSGSPLWFSPRVWAIGGPTTRGRPSPGACGGKPRRASSLYSKQRSLSRMTFRSVNMEDGAKRPPDERPDPPRGSHPLWFQPPMATEDRHPHSPANAWSPRHSPPSPSRGRSEEHTSELQSRVDLVCLLLLEKKKKTKREGLREIVWLEIFGSMQGLLVT